MLIIGLIIFINLLGVNYLKVKNYVSMRTSEVCFIDEQCDCIRKRDNYQRNTEYIISKECVLVNIQFYLNDMINFCYGHISKKKFF